MKQPNKMIINLDGVLASGKMTEESFILLQKSFLRSGTKSGLEMAKEMKKEWEEWKYGKPETNEECNK